MTELREAPVVAPPIEVLFPETRQHRRKRLITVATVFLVASLVAAVALIGLGIAGVRILSSATTASHTPTAEFTQNEHQAWRIGASFPTQQNWMQGVSCTGETCVAVGSSLYSAAGDGLTGQGLESDQTPVIEYSADGGRVWRNANVDVNVSGLGSVTCLTPTTCIATGSESNGGGAVVIRSTDGGRSWTGRVVSGLSQPTLSCLSATRCLLEATPGTTGVSNATEVAVSTDGGIKWRARFMLPPAVNQVDCPTVSYCVSTGYGGNNDQGPLVVEVSRDGGHHWSRVAVPDPSGYPLTVSTTSCNVTRCLLFGSGSAPDDAFVPPSAGVVLEDEGTTAVPMRGLLPSTDGYTARCRTVLTCIAVGDVSSEISHDGGISWAAGPHTQQFRGDVIWVNATCGTATQCVEFAYPGNWASFLVSDDGGLRWSTRASAPGWLVNSISCPTAATCLGVGAADSSGASFLISPHGAIRLESQLSGRATLTSVSCVSAADCVAVGSGPGAPGVRAAWSNNLGLRWHDVRLPRGVASLNSVTCASGGVCIAGGQRSISPFAECPSAGIVNSGNVYFCSGVLLRTSNGGRSWVRVASGVGDIGAVTCGARGVCLAAAGNAFEVSTDDGRRWKTFNTSAGTDANVVACNRDSRCFAVLGTSPTQVSFTSDLARSWPNATVSFSSKSARDTQWLYDEMQCSSDMTCVAAGGSDASEYDGVALVSEQGGTRWGEANLPPGTGAITAIGCTPAGLCVATAPILGHQAAVLTYHASGW